MMKITLKANKEKVIDLGIDAKVIKVANTSQNPVYLKNDSTVRTRMDKDTYKVDGNSTSKIDFSYDNCWNLHLICAEDTELEVIICSTFKGIHRGTLEANKEIEIDFRETPASFLVQNLSSDGDLYFAMGSRAQVNGSQSIKVPSQVEMNDIRGVQKIRLISDKAVEYQVVGIL